MKTQQQRKATGCISIITARLNYAAAQRNMNKAIWFFTILLTVSTFASSQIIIDSIPDGSGYTYIASPTGAGTFPAVLYNHGGLGTAVGGDLRGTVIALAQAGYFARAEKRMETMSIAGHLAEVEAALNDLLADPRADTGCVSIMGFSRGGMLTLQAGKSQANKVHAIVSMAPASVNGQLSSTLADVSPIDDPVLVLVANNDSFQDDHVALAQMTYDSLIAGGKTASLTIFPSYDSNGDLIINGSDDGHELFFVVQEPYWTDVINFLNAICLTTGINHAAREDENYFSVYPNPFSGQIHFRIPGSTLKAGELHIHVLDVFGHDVYSQSPNKEQETWNPALPGGVYFLQIKNGNFTHTKKLVVLK